MEPKLTKQFYSYFTAHYNFSLYGDQAEFSMYKFPERSTTYKVNSGGWALYSEPHFQGKVMYQFGSKYRERGWVIFYNCSLTLLFFLAELVSNDPPNKENPYKSYFTTIASARPIRGLNYRTPIIRVHIDWNSVVIKAER